jgi:hypothetical protein
MVYKVMNHVTLLRMRQLSPTPTLAAYKERISLSEYLLYMPECHYSNILLSRLSQHVSPFYQTTRRHITGDFKFNIVTDF